MSPCPPLLLPPDEIHSLSLRLRRFSQQDRTAPEPNQGAPCTGREGDMPPSRSTALEAPTAAAVDLPSSPPLSSISFLWPKESADRPSASGGGGGRHDPRALPGQNTLYKATRRADAPRQREAPRRLPRSVSVTDNVDVVRIDSARSFGGRGRGRGRQRHNGNRERGAVGRRAGRSEGGTDHAHAAEQRKADADGMNCRV